MGILIPLYTYPTSQTWSEVSVEKQRNPTVNITAVINPDNGVGVFDANYIMGVKRLQLAGVTVLGYVATGYGARAMASIQAECARYAAWYSVDGIFFDEYQTGWQAPPVPGLSIGNPGTDAIGNIPLVTYESAGMPGMAFQGNYIAHTVGGLPSVYPKPAYYYITDDRATYMVLPTYFSALVAGDSLMSNPTSPPQAPRTMTLIVDGKTYTWNVT